MNGDFSRFNIVAAIAAAIYTTVNSGLCTVGCWSSAGNKGAADGDVDILTHGAKLTTTIYIAIDVGIVASDVYLDGLRLCQLRPDGVRRPIQQCETAHATAKDVTTIFCSISGCTGFSYGGIMYVDLDVTVFLVTFIFLKLFVEWAIRIGEVGTH